MPAPNLKTWRLERGAYVSPPLDAKTFAAFKKFFIRAVVIAEFNAANRMIRIPINNTNGKKNLETLLKLKLIEKAPSSAGGH